MELYEYNPIDLEECSFRLIHLPKQDNGPLRCELFHADLRDTGDGMEYEALSYTWGDLHKSHKLDVNGKILPITRNLYLALQHLRDPREDRILWIDALCIDQENLEERGHQVRQMASIYENAIRVIIWLGQSTTEIDIFFHYMNELEKQALDHACNSWNASDERWELLWDNVELELRGRYAKSRALKGSVQLSTRPWFKRAWIIQEVAKARSARVMCGAQSVSARILAVTPVFSPGLTDPHIRAILDIMPGPSRKSSWWNEQRDLRTLLHKFRGSEATDPRDSIYALLGMCSDAFEPSFPIPDYKKCLGEVMFDTVIHFFDLQDVAASGWSLPYQKLDELLDAIPSLGEALLEEAILDNRWGAAKTLLDTGNANGNSVLLWAAEEGHTAVVELLLKRSGTDFEVRDSNGSTPLLLAARYGHKTIVKLLLDTGKVEVNSKDNDQGSTPLSWAAQNGHVEVVKLLLSDEDVEITSGDWSGSKPFSCVAGRGRAAGAHLSFDTAKINVDSRDKYGRTPLSYAAQNGHEAIVSLLLYTNRQIFGQ